MVGGDLREPVGTVLTLVGDEEVGPLSPLTHRLRVTGLVYLTARSHSGCPWRVSLGVGRGGQQENLSGAMAVTQ